MRDVVFEDVCIRDARNPIWVETAYTAYPATPDERHDRVPEFRDILFRNIAVFGGVKVTLEGLDANHKLQLQFDNVSFDDPSKMRVSAVHADVKVAPGGFSLPVAGDDVTVSGNRPAQTTGTCVDKFVPFPLK